MKTESVFNANVISLHCPIFAENQLNLFDLIKLPLIRNSKRNQKNVFLFFKLDLLDFFPIFTVIPVMFIGKAFIELSKTLIIVLIQLIYFVYFVFVIKFVLLIQPKILQRKLFCY